MVCDSKNSKIARWPGKRSRSKKSSMLCGTSPSGKEFLVVAEDERVGIDAHAVLEREALDDLVLRDQRVVDRLEDVRPLALNEVRGGDEVDVDLGALGFGSGLRSNDAIVLGRLEDRDPGFLRERVVVGRPQAVGEEAGAAFDDALRRGSSLSGLLSRRGSRGRAATGG